MVTRRRRSGRGDGALLRDEIIEATTRRLAELGDADRVTIRMICDDIGITPPSLYLHFSDKTELLSAVIRARFDEFERHLTVAASEATDPFDALDRRSHAYVRFALENSGHYRALFSADAMGSARALVDRAVPHPGESSFRALIGSVRACLDAGASPGGDAAFIALQLWTFSHGLVDLMITKPDIPWPNPHDMVDDVLRRFGLAEPPASAGRDGVTSTRRDGRRRAGRSPAPPRGGAGTPSAH
jgi:AcrR family transcriptional regulator